MELLKTLVDKCSTLREIEQLLNQEQVAHPNPSQEFVNIVLARMEVIVEQDDGDDRLDKQARMLDMAQEDRELQSSDLRWFVAAVPAEWVTRKQEEHATQVLASTDRSALMGLYWNIGNGRLGRLTPARADEIKAQVSRILTDMAYAHLSLVEQGEEFDYDCLIAMQTMDERGQDALLRRWYQAWCALPFWKGKTTYCFRLVMPGGESHAGKMPWDLIPEIASDAIGRLLADQPNNWSVIAESLNEKHELGRQKEIDRVQSEIRQAQVHNEIERATTVKECLQAGPMGELSEHAYNRAISLAHTWGDYWAIHKRGGSRAERDGLHTKAVELFWAEFKEAQDFATAVNLARRCPWRISFCKSPELFKSCLALASTTDELLQLYWFCEAYRDCRWQAIEAKLPTLAPTA